MYLADTATLSEPTRPRPDPNVVRWFDRTPIGLIFTSVLVLGEIRKGLTTNPRRGSFEWLESVTLTFDSRILPVTLDIAQQWGEMSGEALRRGTPLPGMDSLIAATAIVHNLTVVTRNVADFERCGARVLSPWTGRA